MIDALIQFILILRCSLYILSVIETLICQREIKFDRIYCLRFCTNYDRCCSKYRISFIAVLSSTNVTKIDFNWLNISCVFNDRNQCYSSRLCRAKLLSTLYLHSLKIKSWSQMAEYELKLEIKSETMVRCTSNDTLESEEDIVRKSGKLFRGHVRKKDLPQGL